MAASIRPWRIEDFIFKDELTFGDLLDVQALAEQANASPESMMKAKKIVPAMMIKVSLISPPLSIEEILNLSVPIATQLVIKASQLFQSAGVTVEDKKK